MIKKGYIKIGRACYNIKCFRLITLGFNFENKKIDITILPCHNKMINLYHAIFLEGYSGRHRTVPSDCYIIRGYNESSASMNINYYTSLIVLKCYYQIPNVTMIAKRLTMLFPPL